ncbi:hypothetical protein VTO42DRAFT_6803 [Malbranchea cinnamomea]
MPFNPNNPTGFDMKIYKEAASPNSVWAKKDPWARHEAWRYSGPFSRWNRFKAGFPGLGIATVAFAAYCTYEHFFLNTEEHHKKGHHNVAL